MSKGLGRRLVAMCASILAIACSREPAAERADSTTHPVPDVAAAAPDSFRVAFETTRGNFVVDVIRAWSPRGVDRFHELVTAGYFRDIGFIRVVPGFVAQFGMHGDPAVNRQWEERTIPDDPVVQSNKRGTLVFATRGPNTRGNQSFINFSDNARLDAMGFSPFGRVVEGMSVVDSIYSGYGEAPDQGRVSADGNAYLKREVPQLDYIKSVRMLGLAGVPRGLRAP